MFLVYSFFERIRIVYLAPLNRYFIIKAILLFHFIPTGYLCQRFEEVFLPDIGRIYRHTFVNGSQPAVIFAPNERYINAAYENIGVTYTLFFNDDRKLSGLYIK